MVGVAHGDFAKALGSTKLTTQIYNAGPAEMTALLGGQLDAAYVGPSAALSAYVQSHGEALRIVAGATTGGAELVVKPGINTAADLKGKTLATPQKGNTQDVALRYWLKQPGPDRQPRRHRGRLGQTRRTTRPRWTSSRPGTSTAPGCRSRGPRGW